MKSVLAGNEAGLIAAYRFNEGTGTDAADSTANAYDITLSGPVFDGDANAAGFNPAVIGLEATYLAKVTVIDSVAPQVVATDFPAVSGDGYYSGFSIQVSEDLDPETVYLPQSFGLIAAGEDGTFDTADDAVYTLEVLDYVRGPEITFTILNGPLQPGLLRFQATASLEDRAGNSLVPYSASFTLTQLGDYIIERFDETVSLTPTRRRSTMARSRHPLRWHRLMTPAGSALILVDDGLPDFAADYGAVKYSCK